MAWAGGAAAGGVRATTDTLSGAAGHKLTLTVVDPSLYATGPVQAELRLLDESGTTVAQLQGLMLPRQPMRLHYTVPSSTSGRVQLRAVATLRTTTGRLVTPVLTFESADVNDAVPAGVNDIAVLVCPMHTPPVPPPNDGPVTNQSGPTITTSPAPPPPQPPPGGSCDACGVERVP
jgi:hypothetical protein